MNMGLFCLPVRISSIDNPPVMTVDERLALIRAKVKRAKKHIRDLEREISAFLDSNPYEIGTKPDPPWLSSITS